jgi:hypothetical protein
MKTFGNLWANLWLFINEITVQPSVSIILTIVDLGIWFKHDQILLVSIVSQKFHSLKSLIVKSKQPKLKGGQNS